MTTDLDLVKDAIVWARARRLTVTRVTVGAVTIELLPDVPAGSAEVELSAPPDVGNLYRTFGGEAVAEAMKEAEGAVGVIEDDEDEVAIVADPPARRRKR